MHLESTIAAFYLGARDRKSNEFVKKCSLFAILRRIGRSQSFAPALAARMLIRRDEACPVAVDMQNRRAGTTAFRDLLPRIK